MSNYIDSLIKRGQEVHEAIVRIKKSEDAQTSSSEAALSNLYLERITILEKLSTISVDYTGIADVKSKLEAI